MRTNLQHESRKAPRVAVLNDAAAVPDHFDRASNCRQTGKCPLPRSKSLGQVYEKTYSKQRNEYAASCQGWTVSKQALLNSTCFEGTFAETYYGVVGHNEVNGDAKASKIEHNGGLQHPYGGGESTFIGSGL